MMGVCSLMRPQREGKTRNASIITEDTRDGPAHIPDTVS